MRGRASGLRTSLTAALVSAAFDLNRLRRPATALVDPDIISGKVNVDVRIIRARRIRLVLEIGLRGLFRYLRVTIIVLVKNLIFVELRIDFAVFLVQCFLAG